MKTYISILVNIRGCQSWTIYYLSSIFFWILCTGRKLPT